MNWDPNEAVLATEAGPTPRDMLAGKDVNGCGTAGLVPPGKKQRAAMPPALLKVIAERRNRTETTFSETTGRTELARHGACTFWGLPTRTAATIAARTLLLVCLTQDQPTRITRLRNAPPAAAWSHGHGHGPTVSRPRSRGTRRAARR